MSQCHCAFILKDVSKACTQEEPRHPGKPGWLIYGAFINCVMRPSGEGAPVAPVSLGIYWLLFGVFYICCLYLTSDGVMHGGDPLSLFLDLTGRSRRDEV